MHQVGSKLLGANPAEREGLFIAALIVTLLVGVSARTEFNALRILRQHHVLQGAAASNGALIGTAIGSQLEVLLLWVMGAIGLYVACRIWLSESRMAFRTALAITGLSHAPVCFWAAAVSTAAGTFLLSVSSTASASRWSSSLFEDAVLKAIAVGTITKVAAYLCAVGAAILLVRGHEGVSYRAAGGLVGFAVVFCLVVSRLM